MEYKSIRECFEMQLSEVEMLSSMYPKSTEFVITDPSVVCDVTNYLEGKSSQLLNNLDFTLYLNINGATDALEVNVILPHRYPNVPPEVYARSTWLTRENQTILSTDISKFLSKECQGELCVLPLIYWLQQEADRYLPSMEPVDKSDLPKSDQTFSRIWLYSHHIYNKDKRRDILQHAKNLNLSGFSLPGKPGVVCVEGYTRDCDDFLQRIRQMSWKKISLVKRDTAKIKKDVDQLRRFQGFNEIVFEVRKGPAREYHMDMGGFYKYLNEHNVGYVFQDIFGVEGHKPDDKS